MFFVCGDGRHMAPAVRETPICIHQERHGTSSEEARAWLERMAREGRFVEDVFDP